MIKNLPLIILFFIIITPTLHAQYENVWAFGWTSAPLQSAAGLDFNNPNNDPELIATKIQSQMGCASVCNSSGELQFYTNGDRVWNKNHSVMPGGSKLIPLEAQTGQSFPTGSALIVPMPDSADKYYLFSISSTVPNKNSDYGKLFYSIVDMSLNNGLGEIDPNRKGILIDSGLGTHLTGVVGDRCNVWILVCSRNHDIKAYELTPSGLNLTPVLSPGIGPGMIPYSDPHLPGVIKASPDRKKLAITILGAPFLGNYGNNPSAATLYDFDAATGLVSNPLPLLEFGSVAGMSGLCDAYGVCFSPDNSKLYINYGSDLPWPMLDIVQFDLSSGIPSSILASKFVLGYNGWFSDIKQGPDGKLYFAHTAMVGLGSDMGSISEPNLAGTACQFLSYAFPLRMPGVFNGNWLYALPNVVPVFKCDTIFRTETLTGLCNKTELVVKAMDTTGWDYVWNDGHTGIERSVSADGGTYHLSYHTAPCVFHTDTFVILPWEPFIVDLGNDTTLCNDQSLTLNASDDDDVSYLWQDGSRGKFYTANQSGTYWVEVTKGNCTVADTIQITLINVVQDLGQNIILCKEEPLQVTLKGNVPVGADVLWSTGNTTPNITVTDTGQYWVNVYLEPCYGNDTILVSRDFFCECQPLVPNVFTPNGDGLNDKFGPALKNDCPVNQYALRIYNRFGQRVYSSYQVDQPWDGNYANGSPAEGGTYFYELQYKGGTKMQDYYQKGDVLLIR